MRKIFFISVVLVFLISCEKQSENTEYSGIAEITMENYPCVDGSTSTDPLNLAYKLYQWLQTSSGKIAIKESGYIPK